MLPIICAGNFTIDVLIDVSGQHETVQFRPAGSAVNIAQMLSSLGCTVSLIGSCGGDQLTAKIIEQLAGARIDLSLIKVDPIFATQLIGHIRVVEQGAVVREGFCTLDSQHGTYLPRFVDIIYSEDEIAWCRYIKGILIVDRISRNIMKLIDFLSNLNWIVILDLSSMEHYNFFHDAYKHCTILKYSEVRLDDLSALPTSADAKTIIHTAGTNGVFLRYANEGFWHSLEAKKATTYVDSIGSGDAITAWLASQLARNPDIASSEIVRREVARAQILATLNCAHRGALGPLWGDQVETIEKKIGEFASSIDPSSERYFQGVRVLSEVLRKWR